MRTLIIEAENRASANGFRLALREFRPELVETVDAVGTQFAVRIPVDGETDILAVLATLTDYVNARDGGAAVVVLDEHRYTLHAT